MKKSKQTRDEPKELVHKSRCQLLPVCLGGSEVAHVSFNIYTCMFKYLNKCVYQDITIKPRDIDRKMHG